MAFEGFLAYAGTEIVNVARLAAYSGVGAGCGCRELNAGLEDPTYLSPALDPAPWYDPSVPESGRFFGLMGLEIIGADSGTLAYAWTELLGDGGVPGAGRRASKEIEVRAVGVAEDRAAMSYGMGWLASALRGSSCRDVCFGDEVCLLAACPQRPADDPGWNPANGSPTYPGVQQLLRTAYNATLLDGPDVTGRNRVGPNRWAYQVRFTLRLGIPYWYRQPRLVARGGGGLPPDPNVYQDTIVGYDPWNWQATCQQPTTCLTDDPFCQNPPLPPVVAPIPPDGCNPLDARNYGKQGSKPPYDNPNGYRFNAARAIFTIARGTGTDWGEKVPIITLNTGSVPWRRLIFRWYDNPTGRPCDGSLDPCNACAEISVPYLPRATTFTLDGRTRRAIVDCPGPGPLVEPRMYGAAGGPFTWPVFECASGLCCEVITEVSSLSPESWIEVDMATREDAV